jgi:flagellar biogenesis protein FliO
MRARLADIRDHRRRFAASARAITFAVSFCLPWSSAKGDDRIEPGSPIRALASNPEVAPDRSSDLPKDLSGVQGENATNSATGSARSADGSLGGASMMRRGAAQRRSSPFGSKRTPWYRSGLVSTVIVLGVVWLAYRAARRWIPGSKVSESGVMQVLARTTLTPKQHVALVRLGHRFVMVGVSPDRIDRLCVIDDAPEVSELLVRLNSTAGSPSPGFDDELMREVSGYESDSDAASDDLVSSEDSNEAPRAPLKELVTRLRSLQDD